MGDTDADLLALSTGYASAVDERDVDRFLAVFAPDAVLVVERPDRPRSELAGHGALARVPPALDRYERTEHIVGTATFEHPSASTATGEVACVAHHVLDGVDTVMTISYLDGYERSGGRWWIARRVVRVLELEDRPA